MNRQTSIHSSTNYVWNIKDVLGHGATCEVYKAFNKTTGSPTAVKVFNRGGYSRAMYQQQVLKAFTVQLIQYNSSHFKFFQKLNFHHLILLPNCTFK